MNKEKKLKMEKKATSKTKVKNTKKKTNTIKPVEVGKKVKAKKSTAKKAVNSKKTGKMKTKNITKDIVDKNNKEVILEDKKVVIKNTKEKDLVLKVVKENKEDRGVTFLVIKSKKTTRWIYFFIILMLAFLIYNSLCLLKARKEIKEYSEIVKRIDSSINNEERVDGDSHSDVFAFGWRSFSDSFSSSAYLDLDKNDLFLDTSVTALTFPPIYSFEKASSENVDSSWFKTGIKDPCLLSPSDNCLMVIDSDVFYNNKKIDLPKDMNDEKIKKIDSSFLSSIFVLSFTVESGEEERAYSYFFDGKKYTPLIGKSSLDRKSVV